MLRPSDQCIDFGGFSVIQPGRGLIEEQQLRLGGRALAISRRFSAP